MSAARCVILGSGRSAGGFIAPVLRAAGYEVVLVGRDRQVIDAIATTGGIWLNLNGGDSTPEWIDGVTALTLNDPALPAAIAAADLLGTSVGPSALESAGQALAPLLRARLDDNSGPINIITFENHRSAPERLATGLLDADTTLASEIGRRVGIGGGALWRAISRREVAPDGVCFTADDADECYVDAASLLPGLAPLDGSVPGLTLVQAFDDRMVEKLWLFNAGHAAAAYWSWRAGYKTLAEGLAQAAIYDAVKAVVDDAQIAFEGHLARRPGSEPIPARLSEAVLARYANPTLADEAIRVGREPRRKLAPNDRLIGPALACLAAGHRPGAVVSAAAAALAYAEPTDRQAVDLQHELEILSPEEVLATVSMLDPHEELARLIGDRYRATAEVTP